MTMNEPTLFDIPVEDAIGELVYDTKCHETALVFPDDLTIIRELAEHNAWKIDNDHTLAAEEWNTKTYYHKLDMGDYSPGELDEYDSQIDALFGAINDILKEAHEQLMAEREQCFYGNMIDYAESLNYWYNITAPLHGKKQINYRDFIKAVLG